MARVYNFSAGPSQLPESVLKSAASELLEYGSSGQSVMEMSHRSPEYQAIIDSAEALLREVLNIPDNYKVLFLQGGASLQFTMLAMNLMNGSHTADYVVTGVWGKKAAAEGAKIGNARVIASSADKNFSYIPKITKDMINPEADYVHVCWNNTIYGTAWHQIPDTGDVPLVADMSSCFLSEPVDVSKFGMIYAGAQKNLAPAGVTIVIIREDLVGKAPEGTPAMLDYKNHVDAGSMYNTPPCWCIYMCKLVLEWIKNDIGGLEKMKERNQAKAAKLYAFLESSKLFKDTVEKEDRSIMNVPFVTGDAEMDKKFVAESKAAGFVNLKGHRSVGGMRASIYNAMQPEGVDALIEFMKKFEAENSK